MSGLDPHAPSQPTQQTSLNQGQNPASKTSQEQSAARDTSSTQSKVIDHRSVHDVPSEHGQAAQPSSLGAGERGALTEKQIPESDVQNYSKGESDLESEKMRMPGEGEVARAVRTGGGRGYGEEQSLTANMEKKAADHDRELHRRGERIGKEIEEEEQEDWTEKKADIASALGNGREGRDGAGRPAVVLAAEE
ncbi:uncharacterized protein Z519_12408 [Cladophialophora bantiana CBS 173.52]|uniref:Uncharacterized protein n=1 Tax=Cladophialophora bantiana (strain ATCC 10958 / CBS 173.52 / CDC B-1940 / NIH 8579) TaxID=1442370 RepID=A0A0D2H108_CLAB1|nr:uncharacterized protein Z519_12408 [Cladophialophora bantiana CBS 173.52]KIW86943.1 hypothetical protein Z519_12408 [Cladophialophora bantiana CBS 173.52]